MNLNLFKQSGGLGTIFNKTRRNIFYGLRWKLVIPYLILSVVPILIFSQIILNSLEDNIKETEINKYQNSATVLAGQVAKYHPDYEPNFTDAELIVNRTELDKVLADASQDYRILIFDTKGKVIKDTFSQYEGKTILVPEVLDAFETTGSVTIHERDERVLYAPANIVDSNSRVIGAVLIITSVDESFDYLNQITRMIIILTIIIGLIVAILVLFTSKLVVDPLKEFLSAVERISEGRLDQRVQVGGNNEFTDLAAAFNHMTEKLEQGEKVREEFVSNVSHELKTPLSSIKVLTESILLQENVPIEMYNEFLQDINSEIDRMTNIVNDLLNLVKLDQRDGGLNIKLVDINKMVEEVMKRLYVLAEKKDIELRYEYIKPVNAEVDEMKFTLAVTNIIENSIKYTDDNGIVKVVVDCDHQNAFVTVQDTGIGISEEEQSKVFNRFYRVDKTRDRETGGTGLGLAITHSTVLLHNGSIKLMSKEGEGSTFVIRIPLKSTIQKS